MLRNKRSRRVLAALGGVLMLAGAGTTGTALAADFHAMLNGDNMTPPGDTDGWGRVRITIDDTLNRLCADLEVRSISEVTSAHIYRGGTGEKGAPVVRLERPDDDDSFDCWTIGDELADEIQANPAAFYVGVNTSEFPEGAIRGQVGPGTPREAD